MLIVLAVLLLLNLLPGGTIGGHVLRRVDILGDVSPVTEDVSEPGRCASRAGSRERTGQSVAAAPESEARLCGYLSQRHDLH